MAINIEQGFVPGFIHFGSYNRGLERSILFWEEFEYGKDDWHKLLEVVKKHPGQGLNKTETTPINGLLNKPLEI
jgi:hypothetical protein